MISCEALFASVSTSKSQASTKLAPIPTKEPTYTGLTSFFLLSASPPEDLAR